MAYAKTEKKDFLCIIILLYIFILSAVCKQIQLLLNLHFISHYLFNVITLAFTLLKIYIFDKIIRTIFDKTPSAYLLVWLSVIVFVNGLLSTVFSELYLWEFIALNSSLLLICGNYLVLLKQEIELERYQYALNYKSLFIILASFSAFALLYVTTNLCLYKITLSQDNINIWLNTSYLIISMGYLLASKKYCTIDGFIEDKENMILKKNNFENRNNEKSLQYQQNEINELYSEYELTEREIEILKLVVAGRSNQQISEDLFITVGTVKSHIHSIYGKLGISSRSQLMVMFLSFDKNKEISSVPSSISKTTC